jgi:hypothetical protein
MGLYIASKFSEAVMFSRKFVFDGPVKIKVTHRDLKERGIVRSRFDQHKKIREGRLRRPHKDGTGSMQSAAWWWWDEVLEDLERERNSANAG